MFKTALGLLPLAILPLALGATLWVKVDHGFQGKSTQRLEKDYWRKNLATYRDWPLPDIKAVAATTSTSATLVAGSACSSTPLCMDAIFDGGVPVPATDATISAPVRVSVQTDSAVGAFQVNINDNQGTVAVGGREPARVLGATDIDQR